MTTPHPLSTPVSTPVRLAVIGAGNRGRIYADVAQLDGRARVVAVAEPDERRRAAMAEQHQIPLDQQFADWRELADRPGLADAVIIATQDALHHAPALALLAQGHHVLLEKPIASTPQQCIEIVEAAEAAGVTFAVAHVLRYTPYTQALTRVLADGRIGEIVSVEHLEPIGWWHFAHSYVRGNWRRADQSSPMLLAKCIHDLDWLTHLIGRPATRVSSFGGLHHFRPEQRPAGAGRRCTDCAVEPDCPYSARRLYLSCLGDPRTERWPLGPVTPDHSTAGVLEALRTGPYGRCVYDCDNDVVDHQVVGIEYEGGVTASFTATAFTGYEFRRTRVFGTHGTLDGDGDRIDVLDFRTGNRSRTEVAPLGGSAGQGGHQGGDAGLVRAFLDALTTGNRAAHLPDPRQGLDAHLLTFAAEQARLEGTVVRLDRPAPHRAQELPRG